MITLTTYGRSTRVKIPLYEAKCDHIADMVIAIMWVNGGRSLERPPVVCQPSDPEEDDGAYLCVTEHYSDGGSAMMIALLRLLKELKGPLYYRTPSFNDELGYREVQMKAQLIDGYRHLGPVEKWDSETITDVLAELRRPTFTVEQAEHNRRAEVRILQTALITLDSAD
jgi:hypothetical protein